jgi:hypothetical protein
MQIIVTWSNGMKSELEVEVPAGATALRASFNASAPSTALHCQADGSWACYNQGRVLLGYCLPPKMMRRPVEGITWAEAQQDPGISRAYWLNEQDWERDRLLRRANAHKFHFHGHRTEQEAINCYQEFLRDSGEQEPV